MLSRAWFQPHPASATAYIMNQLGLRLDQAQMVIQDLMTCGYEPDEINRQELLARAHSSIEFLIDEGCFPPDDKPGALW